MRKFIIFTFLLFIGLSINANAQLSGVLNIPGSYATLELAINDLNTQGVAAGGVTLNLLAGNPQNAPVGGYVIGGAGSLVLTTTSSTAQVTIQGNGNIITAPAGQSAGLLSDAIFKLVGADWITISNFNMQENAANLTTTAGSNNMTEFGVALFYVTVTDGANNNTISNNTITLNKAYQNTFGIYSNSTHTSTNMTTSATASGVDGGNSNLEISDNVISNVNNGIIIVGPTAAADHNTNVSIVDNVITNYGRTGTFSGYANVSGTINGILIRNTTGFNINGNSITSSGPDITAGTLNGIQIPTFSNAPVGTFTNNINENSISVRNGFTTGAINGINHQGTSATNTSTLNINGNTFSNCGHTTVTASGAISFIVQRGQYETANANRNNFVSLNVNTTGTVNFIDFNYSTNVATAITRVDSNTITGGFSKTGAGGTVRFFYDFGIDLFGTNGSVSYNDISGISVTGGTILNIIEYTDGNEANSPNKTISFNEISNITGGTSTLSAIQTNFDAASTVNTISNNSINDITSGGTINGITGNTSGTGGHFNITGNRIHSIIATGTGAVTGIAVVGPATRTTVVSKNSIFNLENTNVGLSLTLVNGILITSSSATIFNNLIGDLRAPNANLSGLADAIRGISSLSVAPLTNVNIYYNSIHLNATSVGANFSTSGIFHFYSMTNTTASLYLSSNVIVNKSTPNGGGFTTALRRSAATDLNNFNDSSNNNLYYAGTPGPNNLIYYDGTNAIQNITDLKTLLSPRESNSFHENPTFLSLSGSSSDFLKPDPTIPTNIESGSMNFMLTEDHFGTPRYRNTGYPQNVSFPAYYPDLGAIEFAGIWIITPPYDVGISSIVSPIQSQLLNQSGSDVVAYVMNYGTVPVFDIEVYYRKNVFNQIFDTVGPVVIDGPIAPGDSALVTFTGANQLTGTNQLAPTVKIYTDFPWDVDPGNDADSVFAYLRIPVSSYPYFVDFSSPDTWLWTHVSQSIFVWNISASILGTNPSGTPNDRMARAQFFSTISGNTIMRSTLIDLTGTTNPILSFYRAYRTLTNQNDMLEVLVSTDGGITWSVPLYQRGWNSVPSLATLPPSTTEFTPENESDWKHTIVDLSAYAGQFVVIGLNAISASGNNLWIDNFKISDPDNFSINTVTEQGSYGDILTDGVEINFTALRPGLGNNVVNQIDAGETSNSNVTSQISPDASEGTLAISKYDDFPVNNTYETNLSATTFSGAIFTPDVVANKYWELAFTGDDYTSTATYDIILDISTQLGIVDPDRLYILKRVDQNSPWICVNTITEYEMGLPVRLIASGLQGFSQFGIGTDDGTLPVDLVEFNATVDRNDVTLNWTTAWEENNMRFDVQRRIVVLSEVEGQTESWATVGNVTGSGTTQEQKSYSYLDRNLVTGKYEYRLVQIDFDGNSTADHTLSSQVEVGVPTEFALSQNYPNPFNPTTKIDFQIPAEGLVKLSVFDMSGREIATLVNEVLTPGYYTYDFNGANFASGVYFYKMVTHQSVITKKMLMIK